MDAVLLPVGDALYAVPTSWVREVVTTPALTRLVTAPATVLGLFNLRGEIVPLLDVAALLGAGRTGPVAFAVVLDTRLGVVALSATSFPARRMLDAAPGTSDLSGAATYRVGRQLAVLVDVQAVLDAVTAHHPVSTPGAPHTALHTTGAGHG
jgi:purine-binding chemotaxis protein CheW